MTTYVDNNDGTITDTTTGLMWQKDTMGSMDWNGAVKACSDLELGGQSDWRLPTLKELRTIIYSQWNNQLGIYWSSTTYEFDSSFAWTVYFGGYIFEFDLLKTYGYSVRAVRAER